MIDSMMSSIASSVDLAKNFLNEDNINMQQSDVSPKPKRAEENKPEEAAQLPEPADEGVKAFAEVCCCGKCVNK